MKRILPYAAGVAVLTGSVILIVSRQREQAPRPEVRASPPAVPVDEGLIDAPPVASSDLITELLDPALDFDEQISAVRSLPPDLSKEDIAALIELLRGPMPERTRRRYWYALLNEVMEVLAGPRFGWRGYGTAMRGLIEDREVDPVVRDYAAQHLALWLGNERKPPEPASELTAAMETYVSVVCDDREAFEPVAGTILMSLCDLGSRRDASDFEPFRARLHARITDFASGEAPASLSNRISSIQVAGRLGVTQALPVIRDLARGAAPNPSIRLSSVAALGYFRDPEDRPFLRELAANDGGMRKAAEAALKNFPTH